MIVRPAVGMQQYVAVPSVAALGVCDALPDAGIAWPYGVVDARTRAVLCNVKAHAGYDDEGMFARVELGNVEHDERIREAVARRVGLWADSLAGKPRMPPLAPLVSEYSEKLVDFGNDVRVSYPNGRPYARGVFAGIDIWGRATVRLANGSELEFPPEKYLIQRL